ncbi:MAG TPA: LuxR C-terminal-related transcriptional regulator, partial [Symbiobacteriaceae bacterium]|nr:LuxR C-terminal-related transcriptional regulator [Symbiobacteriaceae bacterium]
IHAAVSFLVEHMPATMRLVVLTRTDPPWPMARLRAHGRLSELRAADLRFTPAEAAEFFARTLGPDLPGIDIAGLAERTEGWIAALQMVAISLDGHPDPHGFVAEFSGANRYITDYLTEEVLARQPEPVRQFLLRASILDRLSAPLCAAVTECPESGALLDRIERANLFLLPLDAVRHWFRFHHLFGDLLRAYLQQTEPELVPVLHSRAAAWYAANGLPLEAARHSLAARDYETTIALIEQHAPGWWAMANTEFAQLLAKIPPEVTHRSALLCTYQAWVSCMFGQAENAVALIEAAERHAPLAPDMASFIALMRVFLADLSGEPYKLTDAVLRAPTFIPEQSAADLRSTADLTLAYLLFINGQFERAGALWQQAADREVARRTTHAIPVAVPLLARMRMLEGKVDEAADLLRRYIAIVRERGEARFFVWGNLLAVLAEALRLQGDLDGAEAQAEEALRVNQAFEIYHAPLFPLLALARVKLASGKPAEALELVKSAEGRTLSPDMETERAAVQVEAWLAAGDVAAAERWARESGLGVQDALSFRQEIRHITFARVLLATGRAPEGQQLLSRLERAAVAGGRLGRLAEIRRLQQQAKAVQEQLLSEREQEILGLIAAGRSNSEIAEALVVTVGTVKTHVHNLLQKLGAERRTEAIARARELGLLK